MGKLKLSPTAQRRLAQAMLAVAAIMLVDTIYQFGVHITWRLWIARQTQAIRANQPSTQPAQPAQNKPVEIAAAIRNRNLFTAPRPQGHGLSLNGVIGNIALFASREGGTVGIKEGESARGVNVKSINQYEVTIEYEGKPETMRLFPDQRGPTAAPSIPPAGARQVTGVMPAPSAAGSAGNPVAAPPGVDLSQAPPEVRARIERQLRERGR